ncbi:lutzicidin-like isoform X1 [Engystomops pustulosus]|uniref:lutzicidin-like isoform X1 n=1 Tax=Engystomops pustulosus TaxID=76066 RepID=UPI003AFB4CA4
MENSFKTLLLFVVVTGVHGRPLAQNLIQDNPLQLISDAIGFYNGESHSDVVFRLYKDEYEFKAGPRGQKQSNFTIKETICLKSENQSVESCQFKHKGIEKKCSASHNDPEKIFLVVCSSLPAGMKEDPVSGSMESPSDPEDDYGDSPEEDYEDHVIIMQEPEQTFLDEDGGDKRISNQEKLRSGQVLGRYFCLECFFDYLPR